MIALRAFPRPGSKLSLPPDFKPPSRRERFLFALGRYHLPVSLAIVSVYFLLAAGTGAYIASESDKKLIFVLFALVSCFGGVVTFISVKPPWLEHIATAGHIAAALRSATDHERPHLLGRIESRLRTAYRTEPMTLSELATFFASTREEHGKRAQTRQAQAAKARAAQQSALAHCATTIFGRQSR